MTTIEAPRTPAARSSRGKNWEKWGWIYMRFSGVLLVILMAGFVPTQLIHIFSEVN